MLDKIKNHLKGSTLFDFINSSIAILIGIFIFFNPFPHTTSIKEICFYTSMVLFLFMIFLKKIKLSNPPLSLPFAYFVIWVFIGLFFALDKSGSIHDFYSHLLRYIVLYYILINFFSSKRHLFMLSWIIVISTTIFSIGILYYYYGVLGHPLSTRLGINLIQITINRIIIVTMFAILLTVSLIRIQSHVYPKIVLLFAFFFLFLSTIMTQTRSVVLALFLSIGILLYNAKKMLAIFYLVFLLIIFVTPIKSRFFGSPIYNDINMIRIKHHFTMVEIIKDYPIFGIGFGMETYKKQIDFRSYRNKLPKNLRAKILLKYPHSMLADVAARSGIVGLTLFCYIIFVFLKMCITCVRHGKEYYIKQWGICMLSAFIMFFFIGLFEPIFVHTIEVVFFTILSMGTIVWKLNKDCMLHENGRCK